MSARRSDRPALVATILAIVAVPALGAQDLAIVGGTVHPVSGPAIDNGTVVVRDGRIAEVGAGIEAPAGLAVIDAQGLHVYPGLFDAYSQLGLTEIGSISATEDSNEIGAFNPHLSTVTAVHPASEVIPVTRANGITHALTAPSVGGGFGRGGGGSVIPGQAAIVHLDGWTVEEMLIADRAAMVIDWPSLQTRSFDFATFSVRERPYSEAVKEYEAKVDELRDWLDAARHWRQAASQGSPEKLEHNLELEALAGILDRGQRVLVAAHGARAIRDAVAFAEEQDLELVLVGGNEAWREKELLAEKGIPVILGSTQRLPGAEDEGWDQPFVAPAELVAAGVKVAFGSFDAARARRLPYQAATAAGHGLSRQAALRAVTLDAAEILGVADRVGSIEAGKLANLIVTDGDPLEIATQVRHLVIRGREVSTENRHREFYERWSARPTR
ncbi:MAG TPA: amidohydrolase family protein [Thermoanaerobaculia bacterium]|nr:amidohydrolase family protein [Thermoanaerobaculia bacterium]